MENLKEQSPYCILTNIIINSSLRNELTKKIMKIEPKSILGLT